MISRSSKQACMATLMACLAAGAWDGGAAHAQTIQSSDCHRALAQFAAIVAHARHEFVNQCENPVRDPAVSCGATVRNGQPFCSPMCTLTHAGNPPRGWDETLASVDNQHACSRAIGGGALAAMGLKDGTAEAPRASSGTASEQASRKFKDLQKAAVADFENDYDQDHQSNAGMKGRLIHAVQEISRILAVKPLSANNPDIPDGLRTLPARRTLSKIKDKINRFLAKMEEFKRWANHAPSGASYLYKAREEAIENAYWQMMRGCPANNPDCSHPHREPLDGSLQGPKNSLVTLLMSVPVASGAPAAAAPGQGNAVSNLRDHMAWFTGDPGHEIENFYQQWDEVRLVRHCRGMLFDIGANTGVSCVNCPAAGTGGTASPTANTPVIGPHLDNEHQVCVADQPADDSSNTCVAGNVVPPVQPVTPGGAFTPPIAASVTDITHILTFCSNSTSGNCVLGDANPSADTIDLFGPLPGWRTGVDSPAVGNGNPFNSIPFSTDTGNTLPVLTLPIGQ